jgi:hypothetical protein
LLAGRASDGIIFVLLAGRASDGIIFVLLVLQRKVGIARRRKMGVTLA